MNGVFWLFKVLLSDLNLGNANLARLDKRKRLIEFRTVPRNRKRHTYNSCHCAYEALSQDLSEVRILQGEILSGENTA